jgi:hypothetical protein
MMERDEEAVCHHETNEYEMVHRLPRSRTTLELVN